MSADDYRGRALRVLVIDDDQALLRMLHLSMASDGLDVTTARDGFEGLEMLTNVVFDVIVLDLQMPRMNGRDFFREMKSRDYDAPVVVLSAYGAKEAGRELQVAAAVSKPFDPDILIDTVRQVAADRR